MMTRGNGERAPFLIVGGGLNAGWDDLVLRGQLRRRDGTAFYLKDGRPVAALFVNRSQDVDPTRALIQGRRRVDEETRARLADPASDLRSLAAQHPTRTTGEGR